MSVAASKLDAQGTPPALVLDASGSVQLVVPFGPFLLTADYARLGGDLVLTGQGGHPVVVIRNFFLEGDPPALVTEGGALIDAALAMRLAGARAPGQYAAAADGDAAQPIGRVAGISGEAIATRVDGTKVSLTKDTPVYEGDIIETAADTALEVVFVDESTFSVGENARMVLDELVFDPSTLEGASSVSVLQGVFVFVSGEIAANNPEQMVVRTPVASIGVRGTAVAIYAAQDGEQNKIVLLTEQTPDGQTTTGSAVITNLAGTIVLDQAFETTVVVSAYSVPATSYIAAPSEVRALVGQLGSAAPDSVQHLVPQSQADQADGPAPNNANGGATDGDQSANALGKSGPPSDGQPPVEALAGEPPPDAPPLDEAMFAEEAGLFEDAALIVEGLLAEDANPPPGDGGLLDPDAALYDEAQLSLDGLSPLTDPALAEAYGTGVPAPPPGDTSLSYSTYNYADPTMSAGTLTSDPLSGAYLDGGYLSDPLGGFGSFGMLDATLAFYDPALADMTSYFAPPPDFSTTSGDDQFIAPTTIISGLTLIGTSLDEVLNGSNLNDFIDGRGGHDSLFGFAGNDILIGGAGNDLIDGGGDFDTVDYSGSTSGVSVNLASGTASDGLAGFDTLVAIEGIAGSTFADSLTGGTGDNLIIGGGGSDVMVGGGGNDIFVVEGIGGAATVIINDGGDSSPTDVLKMGSSGNDALPIDFDYTASGNNLIIRHVLGNPSTEQVTIQSHFTTGTIEFFEFVDATATLTNVSLVLKTGGGTATGSTGNDFIAVADAVGTTVNGGDSNDYLIGNSGSDVIFGGLGADAINGNGGGDTLDGGAGDDFYLVIPTSATTEIITDSSGSDLLEIGGTVGFTARNNGTDLILDFTNGTTASVLNHYAGSPVEFLQFNEGLATYSLVPGTSGTSNDELIAGGTGSQTLSGGGGQDLLYGADGADSLIGGAGSDILVGGAGVDTLTGGGTSENDRFRYFDKADGAAATNATVGAQTGDQITDFLSGTDRFNFLNTAFNFGTGDFTAVNGTTFFSQSGYDGTNAGGSGSAAAHFVFDPTSLTLYHDDGSNGTGYTVIATVQSGATVVAGDLQVSGLGGGTAY